MNITFLVFCSIAFVVTVILDARIKTRSQKKKS